MKLTIKNYDKVIGWNIDSNNKSSWKIDTVYENSDDYTFHLTKRINFLSNPVKTAIIILSRNGVMDGGRYVYKFLPHRWHQVSADWITDLDNVKKAFQSEVNRLD